MVDKLAAWAFALDGIHEERSGTSVPGARALVLDRHEAADDRAFMIGREFAHIHPHPDHGSLHVKLPGEDAEEVVNRGWGEHHVLVQTGAQPAGLV